MSFSGKVKEEICESKAFKQKNRRAFAYGFFLFGREFSKHRVEIFTGNQTVLRLFYRLVADFCGGHVQTEEIKRRSSVFYLASVEEPSCRDKLISGFGHQEGSDSLNTEFLNGEGNLPAFLSGAFLACGTVTTPDSGYRLEFNPPHEELNDALFQLLTTMGYPPKTAMRQGVSVLYYKESGAIEDILTMIGASGCALEVMEVKIYRDIRNRANRAGNCDSANIDKTLKAASQQIEDIKLLYRSLGEENIPEELRGIARLRLENPEVSLRELGELSEEHLSRSGINHRLKRLELLAQKCRIQE